MELLSPVPSDIDIAQSVDPLPIAEIASDAVNAAIAMNLQCGGTVDVLQLTT